MTNTKWNDKNFITFNVFNAQPSFGGPTISGIFRFYNAHCDKYHFNITHAVACDMNVSGVINLTSSMIYYVSNGKEYFGLNNPYIPRKCMNAMLSHYTD